MRGGVKRNIFLRGSPTVEKRIGALIYIDFIDRQTLKFLCVPFEYLQKKRTKSYREGGVSTLNISKEIGNLNQKNPKCPSTGKARVCRASEPSTSFPATKIKKGHVTSSLLHSPLYTTNLYLSLSLSKHFLTNPPRAHVTFLFSPLVPLHYKPPSLSLWKHFFDKPIPSSKKTIIPTKIVVVKNPFWFC